MRWRSCPRRRKACWKSSAAAADSTAPASKRKNSLRSNGSCAWSPTHYRRRKWSVAAALDDHLVCRGWLNKCVRILLWDEYAKRHLAGALVQPPSNWCTAADGGDQLVAILQVMVFPDSAENRSPDQQSGEHDGIWKSEPHGLRRAPTHAFTPAPRIAQRAAARKSQLHLAYADLALQEHRWHRSHRLAISGREKPSRAILDDAPLFERSASRHFVRRSCPAATRDT